MRKYLIPFLTVVLCSCVLYGSGIRVVTGTLSGTVPANVKVGVFADSVTFKYDHFNNGDPDRIFQDQIGNFFGSATAAFYTPVLPLGTIISNTYSITLPDDPSTIGSLIAWNDLNSDGNYDVNTEPAYLPVKSIDNIDYVVNAIGYIDAQVITYILSYSAVSLYINNFNPTTFRTENFDATGAGDFNFTFD